MIRLTPPARVVPLLQVLVLVPEPEPVLVLVLETAVTHHRCRRAFKCFWR